ncbi:drug/metabolite transporter permease [Klebsiella pneumoniae]|uniref:Drug/metabolite transporter permease n=1 Tax=Klebsiella pneumoniae TaxID=573 RepID=A0A2X3EK14_KLEPN|nr:drug/metabolite transporter permease [Klebsiella pneumoniae]
MQLTRGVWQMSLAMIISGSIGAFRAALWFAGD